MSSENTDRENRLARLKVKEIEAERELIKVAEDYNVQCRSLNEQRATATRLASTCQSGEHFLTALRSQIEFAARTPTIDLIQKSIELQKQAEMLGPFHAANVALLEGTRSAIEKLEKKITTLPAQIAAARNVVAERRKAWLTALASP